MLIFTLPDVLKFFVNFFQNQRGILEGGFEGMDCFLSNEQVFVFFK